MTVVGFISDIHGNLTALDAVLSDMPDVDELICLGDIVGYGPHPAECVERVRDVADAFVIGNHGRALVNGYEKYSHHEMAYSGFQHADKELSDAQTEWLAALPEMTDAIDDRVLVVHSHPDPEIRWTPDGYVYKGRSPTLVEYMDEHDVLAFGHTHQQHAIDMGDYDSHGIILNPGSVGQPRDEDPRAAYATVDLDELEATLHRVEYDIGAVQRDIRAAELPQKSGERLELGK